MAPSTCRPSTCRPYLLPALHTNTAETATDNYECLGCKWYNRYEVTALPGSNCRCSTDTAWAFPREYRSAASAS